jgi:hypothetical protein
MKTAGSGQSRSPSKSLPVAKRGNGKAESGQEVSSAQRESDGKTIAEPAYVPSREEKIAIVAYYKAQRRGFASSGELEDWLEAEREVDHDSGESVVDDTRPQT